MKNQTLLIISAIFMGSVFFNSMSLADDKKSYVQIGSLNKLEQKAMKKANVYVEIAKLNSSEKEQVFNLLLAEQKQMKKVKKANKGNKSAYKEAVLPIKAETEIKIAAIIGSDKMDEINKQVEDKKKGKKNK
jgi:hypothetical protein